MPSPIILWFRNDLRLADNRALIAAAALGRPIVPVFILDDDAAGKWKRGGASRWWLAGSLESLAKSLEKAGSRLILRRGATLEILPELAKETGADLVYASGAYEPWASKLESALNDRLAKSGVELKRMSGALLVEPERLRTKAGDPFKVYTPFWRALREVGDPQQPKPAPKKLATPPSWPKSDKLADWKLLPTKPDWAGGMRDAWTPGEAGAQKRLRTFLDAALSSYADNRDRPDMAGTSRLSPHLHFGEISPAQCWHAASAHAAAHPGSERGLEVFLKEVVWREFSYHSLVHWPALPDEPFRPEFATFPWNADRNGKLLEAWQQGRTGYPLVDAGLRQLWTTGWMHNRVRMVAASFLVKHLRLHWADGEAWFWDTLVDADLASNAASWQWVAGSGADAAPYFRIFNPMKQGATFDPEGKYVREWVPELAKLPDDCIHAPWDAPPAVLAAAGVILGKTYPRPVVDHATARDAALKAFEILKGG